MSNTKPSSSSPNAVLFDNGAYLQMDNAGRVSLTTPTGGNVFEIAQNGQLSLVGGTFVVGPSGTITKYNNIASTGQIFPQNIGQTIQRSESAADANVLTVAAASTSNLHRIRIMISVSAASAAVLGWTATWTDSNGNAQAPTNLPIFQIASAGASGTAGSALTFTTSAASNYSGEFVIDTTAASAPIVIKFTLTSGTVTANVTAIVEKLN